jgi:hypothetical protein
MAAHRMMAVDRHFDGLLSSMIESAASLVTASARRFLLLYLFKA